MLKVMKKKLLHKKHYEVYRLHIDATPSEARRSINQASLVHRVEASAHSSSKKILSFLWDKIQFLLVSFFVFIIIYVVLNWQALSLNLTHYWNTWRGLKSPLERLVAEKEPAEEKLLTQVSNFTPSKLIPPLNIEVYPADMRIIIPRINQNVPVVGVKNENLVARDWDKLEADIQKALRNGVIHYPGTALPGEGNNVVVTGHSSYYVWDPGRFKDVFALLHDVRMGDRIVVYFNQKKFVYEVDKIKVVLPKDVDVLGSAPREQLTLITCTPIGTNLKRLIVTAKLVEKS